MLVSELKPFEEILSYLHDETKLFLVGCNGCAEASHTGGRDQVLEMKAMLEEQGKEVAGWSIVEFLCDRALIKTSLRPHEQAIMEADSVLAMTCGVGIQATAASVAKTVHPATNTISMGGAQGEWRGEERCYQCGDCLLDYTGGICPLTACSKGLINGPCGGSRDGMCEVEPSVRPCGWMLIYERLKETGRLDKMREMVPPKAFRKMQPPSQYRGTRLWALEFDEAEVTL